MLVGIVFFACSHRPYVISLTVTWMYRVRNQCLGLPRGNCWRVRANSIPHVIFYLNTKSRFHVALEWLRKQRIAPLTFTCGTEFYYFNNHFTTIMQGCYNFARLRTPCTNYHNLVTTLSQPYKVAARLLQPSYFCMACQTTLCRN